MTFMLMVTINVDGDQCYLMTATRSSVMREKMPWRPMLTKARHPARTSQPTLRQNFLKFDKPFDKKEITKEGSHLPLLHGVLLTWRGAGGMSYLRIEKWASLPSARSFGHCQYGCMQTLTIMVLWSHLSLGALPHESLQVTKTLPHNIIWNIAAENHCHQSLKDDPAQLFSKLAFKV